MEVANAPVVPQAFSYSITAGFKGSSRSTLTVPYGRRVSVRGRMTLGAQPGPGGAQLDILERIGRRASEVAVGSARTEADGSFAYVLPAKRPSRTIRLAYRPPGSDGSFSPVMRLRVRAAASLRASLRGVVMRFRGVVHSRPIPGRGKLVRLEGRAPGSAWKSFATIRTDRRGRFSGRYRLRVHRPGVRLKVRAVVPSEKNYPYVGSRSSAVTLRVR